MKLTAEHIKRMKKMTFASVYPHYISKVEKKGRTKEELLDKSKIYDYDDILKLTWSCWFPKEGKPCAKCPMCKERILDHPK